MNLTVEKSKGLNGCVTIPADKSISHRSAMFAALTGGVLEVKNFSMGADCLSTLSIIKELGCEAEFIAQKHLKINAKNAFKKDRYNLDCGNSGTSMRLFSGIVASREIEATLFGDESLSKRPMKRVILPLELMGAKIKHQNFKAPLVIQGKELYPIDYKSPIASAQVKSCILLAGLNTYGETKVTEPFVSRDHTERMLKYLGADIISEGNVTKIKKSTLEPKNLSVCGDISSAAFFMVAAAIVPNSDIILKNVGLNQTRTGIIDVLVQMGADIEILDKRLESNEEVGDIRIKTSELKAVTIEGEIIPRLIDELPVIAVLASQAEGKTVVKDAGDLRNKESDRIKCLVTELLKLGVDIEETPDGFIVNGKTRLKGGAVTECYHDHRLAMSLYVAGLVCEQPVLINEFQWVDISFPEFLPLMESLF
ncbi:MAG: 3-phosphoshikimate 1-carboxyvinyltransferase [Candidatus Gastranaerophilaceae bacterium]|uniref:3-phosphoshikimate 1-carboxyvinyltransferase n=1 Tax=Candidatus Limenecus avicola TaxID=2840847 RepID=A0A9D1N1B4_9CLOT|nr:3-phosphoshikimate 1-carboxyvinyltransferase [Candidatus Limenecus avicola]